MPPEGALGEPTKHSVPKTSPYRLVSTITVARKSLSLMLGQQTAGSSFYGPTEGSSAKKLRFPKPETELRNTYTGATRMDDP